MKVLSSDISYGPCFNEITVLSTCISCDSPIIWLIREKPFYQQNVINVLSGDLMDHYPCHAEAPALPVNASRH